MRNSFRGPPKGLPSTSIACFAFSQGLILSGSCMTVRTLSLVSTSVSTVLLYMLLFPMVLM